jgi:hypothetical protein
VVKGMKVLRFGSVFRAGSCCQESLQKSVEDPLCNSQNEWSVMSPRLFLAAFQMSEPWTLTTPSDELFFGEGGGVFFPPETCPKVLGSL